MHERSLVRSLLKQVDQLRLEHRAVSLGTVTIELGPLSGVEVDLLQSAFDELAPERFETPPELNIRMIPLQLRCRACQRESSVNGITLRCPDCSSPRVQVTRGDEVRLIDVSMQVPA